MSRSHYENNKEEARRIILTELFQISAFYNVQIKRVAIRNQKSRWGSCSKKGNLNFNYKLLFLSEEQRKYIIVHEVCHLLEFNHSPAFWKQVERMFPNHKNLRKSLNNI